MLKIRGSYLSVSDTVVPGATDFKGRHKIQDRWKYIEYKVISQDIKDILEYVAQSITGRKKVLHRNLLLPIGNREKSSLKTQMKDVIYSGE